MKNENSIFDIVNSVVNNQNQELDTGTLVSILSLSNLLGIITFMNSQKDINNISKLTDINSSNNMNLNNLNLNSPAIAELLNSFIGNKGGGNLDPATLMSMAKMLSNQFENKDNSKNNNKNNQKDKSS